MPTFPLYVPARPKISGMKKQENTGGVAQVTAYEGDGCRKPPRAKERLFISEEN